MELQGVEGVAYNLGVDFQNTVLRMVFNYPVKIVLDFNIL